MLMVLALGGGDLQKGFPAEAHDAGCSVVVGNDGLQVMLMMLAVG